MKNTKKTLTIILILALIVLLVLNIEKINNIISGFDSNGPIDKKTGLIDNEYFGINKYGKDPVKTRDGLNEAIKYASEHKIKNIKLENGTYLIDTKYFDKFLSRGIELKSNMNVDLNGSTITIVSNNKSNYDILSLCNLENVSLFNGTIIGDKSEHEFIGDTTHEWGMGVSVRGSKNINIYNLEIYNTTGDAVYINEYNNKNSNTINVYNCNLHDCRRQGISVIEGENIKIYNNEIHSIGGTIPQAGIDLEKNKPSQIIKNVYIYENKFHSQVNPYCIVMWSYVEYVYVENNELEGDIRINENNNKNNNLIFIGENKHIGDYPVNYVGVDTELTKTFKDENLRNVILKLIGKTETDSIFESDIAKIASDNVAGGKQLNLANSKIKSLEGIEIFAKYNLEWLYIDNNEIEDLTPVSKITSLTKLNASNNKIKNIDVVSNLTNLETVSFLNDDIEDFSVLDNIKNLKYKFL